MRPEASGPRQPLEGPCGADEVRARGKPRRALVALLVLALVVLMLYVNREYRESRAATLLPESRIAPSAVGRPQALPAKADRVVPEHPPEPLRSRFSAAHRLSEDDRETINFRRQVEQQFGASIEQMDLPAEVQHRLKQLMADRLSAAYEARHLIAENGLPTGDLDRGVAMVTNTIDAEIRSLVGGDAFTDLMFMISSDTYSQLRGSFLLDTQFANCPLSPSQLLQLARIFDARAAENNGSPSTAGSSPGGNEADQKIYGDAEKVLTANQLALLHDYLASRHP